MLVASDSIEDGRSSGSHLAGVAPPESSASYETFQRVVVTTVTADTLCERGQAPDPDVIKIDVEGAEQLVLEGATRTLRRARPLLFIEIHNITQMFHVLMLLGRAGYAPEILDADHASVSRCFLIARQKPRSRSSLMDLVRRLRPAWS